MTHCNSYIYITHSITAYGKAARKKREKQVHTQPVRIVKQILTLVSYIKMISIPSQVDDCQSNSM